MAYNYDKLYSETPDALGPPTQEFVDFFDAYDRSNARILDVGCGQGRDALFIARQGHQVVAVDLSPAGIKDVMAAATAEELSIEGIVADITAFQPEGEFDVILIDRTLHMLPASDQRSVLASLLLHLRSKGWLLIADERSNMARFHDVLAKSDLPWSVTKDGKGYLFAQLP